ncbi:hypothetical protein BGW80DRAFT_1456637 [Lactifluus volemus]|nr:hypothetical protein BGW80DRAFT_1456637 [Lactifluus volemus]
MAITPEEAHILITLPNATLTSPSTGTLTGQLSLEYITFDIPASAVTRDVLLVLRLDNGAFEAPLDPARTLTASVQSSGAARRYVFHATQDDAEFTLEIPVTPETSDDVELFHSVLVEYVTNLRDGVPPVAPTPGVAQNGVGLVVGEAVQTGDDLRGRFVLVNEDNGEIVDALGRSVRVYEDPSLGRGVTKVLVRTVPPEDRDWMMKGAVFARHVPHFRVISDTATLLAGAMTSASNHFIAHSTPSPASSKLLLLQSPTTKKHLTRVHTVTDDAVKLGNKATVAIERLISRRSRTANPPPAFVHQSPPPAPQSLTPLLRPLARVAYPAAIVLTSLEASTARVIDAGSASVSAAVSHKYGPTAAGNVALAGGTVRNVVLVYMDVQGLGRRAVVKVVAKGLVKGHIARAKGGSSGPKL